ncbi:MAG: HAD hydrolase family protein [Thermotogae bacterium]|nr:HAD hydrolase family protein [Thermotogota bacterium]
MVQELAPKLRLLVFTDVDGTLIDHFTYRYDEALPVLAILKTLKVPVILNTSKTFPETRELMEELGLNSPFAVENGAAVFFPEGFSPRPERCDIVLEGYCGVVFGRPHDEVRKAFLDVARSYPIRSVLDMDDEEISALTGLPPERIPPLKSRMFSEPFLMEGDIQPVIEEFSRRGFRVLKGGRFYHLLSEGQDKGKVVEFVRRLYGGAVLTVGLGDGKNDEDMLRRTDLAILIPNPKYGYAPVSVSPLRRARCMGPKGWAEEMTHVLRKTLPLLSVSRET